jgi:hypothetical protein
MYWDAKVVKPLLDYRIFVEVVNGRKGVFDMKPYLERGVFRELKNINYFNQVDIVFGAVTWPHEQDIAPETLLAELRPLDEAVMLPGMQAADAAWSKVEVEVQSALAGDAWT